MSKYDIICVTQKRVQNNCTINVTLGLSIATKTSANVYM